MSARILLVEDNEQNCYLVRYLLEHAGHTVIQAHDGHDALQSVQSTRFDLVLMDIQMPKMDGWEAARLMHATPGMKNMPVVALTSFVMTSDRERTLNAGFAGHIEKPICTERFVAEIESFLTPSLSSL